MLGLPKAQLSHYPGRLFQSKYFLIFAVAAFFGLMGITMYKDFYFTGNMPNPIFYLTVPTFGIIISALAVFIVSGITNSSLSFSDTLKIVLASGFAMQVIENVAKVIYYVIWKYPGFLWFITFPISLCITIYLFFWVTKVKWRYNLLFSIVLLVTGNGAALIFIYITGISTPGS